MKKLIFFGFLFLIFYLMEADNRHIPCCGGHYESETATCRGYAIARAFGRTKDSHICCATTIKNTVISENYFELIFHDENGISNNILRQYLQAGDIIEFSGHAGYVKSVGIYNIDSSSIDHKEGSMSSPKIESLGIVKSNWGSVKKLWRKKDQFKMKVKNSFEGGKIKVDNGEFNSGVVITGLCWESIHDLIAIEDGNVFNNYTRIFKYWKKGQTFKSSDKLYDNMVVDWEIQQQPTFTAVFHKEYKIYFHNQFEGVQLDGKMQVNGNIYNNIEDHNPFRVEEKDSISFKALAQEYNGIKYSFDHWNDQSSSSTRSVHPEDHDSYTAYFQGKPEQVENVYFDCDIGEPIKLVWNEHQNQDVNYRIYRSEKDQNGNIIESHLIATVQHGTTSYTDRDFLMSANYDFLLRYDVRAHYTIENTEADINWHAIFGKIGFDKRNIKNLTSISLLPKDFEISNYPNPFNSFTCIKYALPKASVVNISIYNIKGQLVRALYQGYRKAGYYTQTWDGTNQSGSLMPAGIYLVTMECKDKTYRNKLILLK